VDEWDKVLAEGRYGVKGKVGGGAVREERLSQASGKICQKTKLNFQKHLLRKQTIDI